MSSDFRPRGRFAKKVMGLLEIYETLRYGTDKEKEALADRISVDQGLAGVIAEHYRAHPHDDYGLEPGVARLFNYVVHKTLYSGYFRTELLDTHNIPDDGALLAANHSGSVGYDAVNVTVGVYYGTGRFVRGLAERFFKVFSERLYRLLTMQGAIEGKRQDAIDLLDKDELVLVFPGGTPDISKLWYDKYKVKPVRGFKPGSGGYIKCALAAGKPVIPVAIVGAEEIHTCFYNSKKLGKKLGLPYLPFFLPLFPLPAKMYIQFGEPVDLSGYGPDAADDQDLVDRLNEEVRSKVQEMLDDLRSRRKSWFRGGLKGG